MKPRSIVGALTKVAIMLSIFSSVSFADPVENPQRAIQRKAHNSSEIQTQLSKNNYRQEPYQAEYTVEVPYEVDVPYTDYEEYYDNEYICRTKYENECGYERECRNVPVRECRNERKCRFIPGEQTCRQVEECGTNSRGERVCKTRQVCERSPGRDECRNEQVCDTKYRQECSNEYRCRNVPRERCGYEQVRKTRPVTKYRKETRYRTETRCCVTKYKDVFDSQSILDVTIRFPQGSELIGNEVENFNVAMINQNDANLQIVNSIFGYRVNKSVSGKSVLFDLILTPKYSEQEVGLNSIKTLDLNITGAGSQIIIEDVGHKNRVQTQYAYTIRDANMQIISQGTATNPGSSQVVITLSERLDDALDYQIELQVSRSGLVLAQPVNFKKTDLYSGVLEATPFAEGTINTLGYTGSGSTAVLSFVDSSPIHPAVTTIYNITIEKSVGTSGSKKEAVTAKTFARGAIPEVGGKISLNLTTHFGLKAADVNKLMTSGKTLYVNIEANRNSPRFRQAVIVNKDGKIKFK